MIQTNLTPSTEYAINCPQTIGNIIRVDHIHPDTKGCFLLLASIFIRLPLKSVQSMYAQ